MEKGDGAQGDEWMKAVKRDLEKLRWKTRVSCKIYLYEKKIGQGQITGIGCFILFVSPVKLPFFV